jgi:hypothetical protein
MCRIKKKPKSIFTTLMIQKYLIMKKITLLTCLLLASFLVGAQAFEFNTDGDNEEWKARNDTEGTVASGEYTLQLASGVNREFTTIKNTSSGVIPQNVRYMHLVFNNLNADIGTLLVRFSLVTLGGNVTVTSGISNGTNSITLDLDTEIGTDWSTETVTPTEIRVRFEHMDGATSLPTLVDQISIDRIVFDNNPILSVDKLQKFNFAFYPNPANDRINFSAVKPIQKISLYNLLGKEVLVQENRNSLDVSHLSKGVYLAKVQIEDTVGSIKFVKN